MKKLLLSLLLALICALPVTDVYAQTFPNEPEGFRGMTWGSSIEELEKQGKHFVFLHSRPQLSYQLVEIENRRFISGISYERIVCSFWRDKLVSCLVVIADNNNDYFKKASTLYLSASEKFGKPTEDYLSEADDEDNYNMYAIWKGDKTRITIIARAKDKNTYLSLESIPLSQQESDERDANKPPIDTSGW